jgi:hypothetical protein
MAPLNNTGVANRPGAVDDSRFGLHWPLLAALLGLMALCGCASKAARPVTDSSARGQ